MKICFYDWALHSVGGGQKFDCKIAEHLSKKHEVDILTLFPVNRKQLEKDYAVDLSRINNFRFLYRKSSLHPSLLMLLSFRKVSNIAKDYDLFFNADAHEAVKPLARYNLMYCHFFGLKWPKPARSFLSFLKLSLAYIIKTVFINYSRDYDAIYCNSLYTKKWLKQRWGVNAEVIYPPVDIPKKENNRKKNIVLSLGRLTPDKNYELVIECFKEVYNSSGTAKNYECLICGSEPPRDYYLKLKELAQGYPIKIIIGLNAKELSKIYSQSKIFMQAKGFGVDGEKYPALLEHFGMTPVEAMANGCVPIVLNKGGYKESVQNGISGFLFDNKEQATKQLRLLIENKDLLSRMSKHGIERAKKFSLERMQKEIDNAIEIALKSRKLSSSFK